MSRFSLGTHGLDCRFRTVAGLYRLIADDQVPVLVRYDEAAARLIDRVIRNTEPPNRYERRRLQQYAVNVHRAALARFLGGGAVEAAHPGVFVLKTDANYDVKIGLIETTEFADPEGYVV